MATDSSPDKQKRRLSYPVRLFLWLMGYSLLLVGAFVVFQYHRERDFKTAEIDGQLQQINRFILSEINDGKSVDELVRSSFHPFDNLRVSLLDSAGNMVYDSRLDRIGRVNHSGRQEIAQAMKTGAGRAVHRPSESTGETYFYSATRGEDGVIVRTALPYRMPLEQLLKADYGFLWVMSVVTLVMCVLGYFATRRVGQHIIRLNRFARRAEGGERISDVEPFPHDELGEISNHIVRLYANLQQTIAERDREHQTALHQQQEKERIKKQLTDNINHELKTPLASIQVCLETLLVHPTLDPALRDEFLERSLANCERLRKLMDDVATITRIEDGSKVIDTEPLALDVLLAEVVVEKHMAAERAGMEIVTSVDEGVSVCGNRVLLESVLNNLIDNAISYSGGTQLEISLRAVARRLVLTVADNGVGVDERHLPQLFERFYRVDKGRSRSAGGTGLGLSIVKNAIHFHHGSIAVENRREGGLRFTITLPAHFTET